MIDSEDLFAMQDRLILNSFLYHHLGQGKTGITNLRGNTDYEQQNIRKNQLK